jgi:putative ABC transport system permease protein
MRGLLQDLRYACRLLRRQPAFTLTAIVALSFGIATNTAVFTLLNAVALRPMPVPDAHEMIRVRPVDQAGVRRFTFSYEEYRAYREQHGALAGLIAYTLRIGVLGDVADRSENTRFVPEEANLCLTSDNYFAELHVRPVIGRSFSADEHSPGHATAVVLSEHIWRRRFAGDPQIIGRSVNLNGHWFTVVGVTPPGFTGTEVVAIDVWVPAAALPLIDPRTPSLDDRREVNVMISARLHPEVSRAQLEAALSATTRALLTAHPDPTRPASVAVMPGTFFTLTADMMAVVWLVLSAVGLVLIVSCANVANLMLARVTARRHEIATRLALGARRGRLVQQLMVETAVISSIAGVTGLLLAWWSLSLLYPFCVGLIPFAWARIVLSVQPDVRVFAYTSGLAVLATACVGAVPALQATREGRTRSVLSSSGDASSRSRRRLRGALVIVQFAVCLVLVASAGLLLRALHRAETLDLGFDSTQVLFVDANLRTQGYDVARATAFSRALTASVRRVPGVTDVSLSSTVPLVGGQRAVSIALSGRQQAREFEHLTVRYNRVTAEYFRTLRIPIVRGRAFTAEETEQGAPVVMISETFARMLWRDDNPIGRTLIVGSAPVDGSDTRPFLPLATVVGVARDSRPASVFESQLTYLYLPGRPQEVAAHLQMLVRADRAVAGLAPVVAAEIRRLDPQLVSMVRPVDTLLAIWLLPSRAGATIGALLGAIALFLAVVGIYGVMSYAVAERVREIGVRMALGARRSDVLGLIVRQGMTLVSVGIATGLLVAAAVTRLMVRLLAGVHPLDPVTLASASAFLALIALVACYIPARRATRIDPLVALRYE